MTASHLTRLEAMRRYALIVVLLLAPATIRAQDPNSQNKSGAGPISGRVLTRDGESIGNVRITVTRYGVANSAQTFRSDGSGAFTTEPLEPGLYGLFASAPGYVTAVSPTAMTPTYYRPGDTATITLAKGGVITGTVKNSNGDAVIAIPVKAIRVRDHEGKKVPFPGSLRERLTDDRGVYRLFALQPGTYVVSAGGQARLSGSTPPTPYEIDAPIYAPSSTRDGATEVALNNGDEATVDIQYRTDPGHIISGVVMGATKGPGTSSFGAVVSLLDLRTRADVGAATASSLNNFAFSIYGVPEGDYELYANQFSGTGETLISPAVQVKVQASDVTGIALAVAPLASIDGRVILESDPKAACGKRRSSAMLETMIFARRYELEDKATGKDIETSTVPLRLRNSNSQSTLDAKGGFNLKNLQAGTFRIDTREPASGWFVRSLTFDRIIKNLNIPRDGVTLKPGERVSGLLVTIAEGAAKLQGAISLGEGQSLPLALRVYLTPSERDAADNLLRFYEARPETNGSFTVDNIAAGKYRIVARPSEENDSGAIKSIRQDKAFRLKVLREAEALKKELALKPCEQLANYDLPFAPPNSQ
jgi:carboxypeptidase family protein